MSESKTVDMTVGSPLKHIFLFSLPLFIGTLFQQAYNFVDTLIAARLSASSLAAIGSTSAIYSLIIAFASGLNGGYSLVLSRCFGSKDYKKFSRAVLVMFVLDVVITLILSLLSLSLLKPIMSLLQTPTEIFDQAHTYIFIILAGLITTIMYNFTASLLRAMGNSKTPLYFLIISCLLNVFLDLLFTAYINLDVKGLALATVISQAVSAILGFIYIKRNYNNYLPKKEDYKFNKDLVKEMTNSGLSMALMYSVFSLGSIILQRSINQLGTTLISAHIASRRIYELLLMPISTISSANSIFVSQNYGANKIERIKTTFKQLLIISFIYSLLAFIIALVFGKNLISTIASSSDITLLENGQFNLLALTSMFFPLALLVILRTLMQAVGYKIIPVISSSIELIFKILSCIYLIPKLGYKGVAITEPIIWIACALFLVLVYKREGVREEN